MRGSDQKIGLFLYDQKIGHFLKWWMKQQILFYLLLTPSLSEMLVSTETYVSYFQADVIHEWRGSREKREDRISPKIVNRIRTNLVQITNLYLWSVHLIITKPYK